MASVPAPRSSRGVRLIDRRRLCRAWVAVFLLSIALSKPCLGQRLASTHALETWPSAEVQTLSLKLSVAAKQETYKSLGSWIGLGAGVLAVPFAWSACNEGPGSCPAGRKTLIALALPLAGSVLGSLVGQQFKKAPADSARRVRPDSSFQN